MNLKMFFVHYLLIQLNACFGDHLGMKGVSIASLLGV